MDTDGELPMLLSIEQACRQLGCGRTKAYELINADELIAIKVGRSTRITRNSLCAFVARREANAREAKRRKRAPGG